MPCFLPPSTPASSLVSTAHVAHPSVSKVTNAVTQTPSKNVTTQATGRSHRSVHKSAQVAHAPSAHNVHPTHVSATAQMSKNVTRQALRGCTCAHAKTNVQQAHVQEAAQQVLFVVTAPTSRPVKQMVRHTPKPRPVQMAVSADTVKRQACCSTTKQSRWMVSTSTQVTSS